MSSTSRCSPPETSAYHEGANFTYSREVLLSLAQLAVCKRLPSDFECSDSSILCEIKDDSSDVRGSNFSYSREVLLSSARLAVCKRLPSNFESSDSSILCEIKDDSGASTSSDSEIMNSTFEARCSPPESSADHKGSNFSYSREVLLSLARLAVCKRLPNSFESSDSSILCEIKDHSSASTSSDSEAGRWHGNLSRLLLPENGILGTGSILKEPKSVFGVSPPRIQGIGYHLDRGDELNNASTSFSESSSDPDSVRLGTQLSQHSKHDTERGILGGGALLKNPGCLAGVSAPIVNGSQYYLVNKSAKPYRPPHFYKMNLDSSTVHKDTYPDILLPSSECPNTRSEEEDNNEKTDESDEGKQGIVSDEQKGKLDSDTSSYPNDLRNVEVIVNKRNQPKEVWESLAPQRASCYTSIEVAACGEKIRTPMSTFEKVLETKSLHESPMGQNCNVKAGDINSCMLSSSNSVDQHTEEAGGILMGTVNNNSEAMDVPSDIRANKHESRSFYFGIIDHETAIPVGSDNQSEGTSVPDDDNEIGGNSLTEQKFAFDSVYQVDEKENATNELCLPDEDSLISLDDLIFPGDYMLTPDHKDHKPIGFNPNIPGNNELASANDTTQVKYYPHSHINPICQQNDPSKNLLAKSNRFSNGFLRPLPHQMVVPCAFPHQLYRMPNVPPSDDSINERLSHSQQLNHTHSFNQSFPRPYRGPHMPNSGYNTPFGIPPQARQMHPPWPQWRNS
ncbi:hypothetical protein M5689_017904 [Euphorbia peplus]|nr:hypothetical protein M5689_017904 [Euphorbia peplus]